MKLLLQGLTQEQYQDSSRAWSCSDIGSVPPLKFKLLIKLALK